LFKRKKIFIKKAQNKNKKTKQVLIIFNIICLTLKGEYGKILLQKQ
jgi:hypothetical protein